MSDKPKPINFNKLAKQHQQQQQQQLEHQNAHLSHHKQHSSTSGSSSRSGGTVMNKQPAPIQITSEQIMREAYDKRAGDSSSSSNSVKSDKAIMKATGKNSSSNQWMDQDIQDVHELEEYRLRKRKEFEDKIRKNDRQSMGIFVRYAKWEESQKQFVRARSIYERALEMDVRNVTIWLRYSEMEARNKFINFARNVYDRAVTLLPRVNQLWYKYVYMEEMLGQVDQARKVFERWMQWHPDAQAWKSYVQMEARYEEYDRARLILRRFVHVHPSVDSWLYFAKFETKLRNVENARKVYTAALKALDDQATEELFVAFAKFEEENNEVERARTIYKFALDNIPKARAQELYRTFVNFEKQHGDREGIEQVIVSQRRFQYEDEVKKNPHHYDTWFDYIRLEEEGCMGTNMNETDRANSVQRAREVYERAISNIPPVQEKRYWRRYIYLWINYMLFEELIAKDVDRAREVYQACMQLVPHKIFSFTKLWIMFAKFEVRQKNIANARMLLGHAIGIAPKDKIFFEYTKIEIRLGNVDRARKIIEKQLEFNSASCSAWKSYAELEYKLGESDRARSIFELAIDQPVLDMPEIIWKAYIDFETAQNNHDRARALYEKLLSRTKHVKVWLSYILFEANIEQIDKARDIFQRAIKYLRSGSIEEEQQADQELERKEQCVILLKNWLEFEEAHGTKETIDRIKRSMPKSIKKKRKIVTEDGGLAGWEEYTDYIFPDEEKKPAASSKILEAAKQWKLKMQSANIK